MQDMQTTQPMAIKRRFWQFHLSTAISMMLIASGWIYLDVAWFKMVTGYAGVVFHWPIILPLLGEALSVLIAGVVIERLRLRKRQ
jgi:hydroxyacyl-ACP dehydratase HTD2-like protein with hotdog domain